MERGVVCGGDFDWAGGLPGGAAPAGSRRGSDVSSKCKSGRLLVSHRGAELGNGDLRFGRKARLCHWCPGARYLLLRFGWRWSFAATGFVSLLYFVLFYLFYRNPSEDRSLSAIERDFILQRGAQPEDRVIAAKGAPLGYLLRQRKVWGLVLGFASYNYTFYLLLTWLPSYLSSTHHVDLLHSSLYTSVPWLFATFTDILVGGWLVDKLVQQGRDSSLVRQVILIGGTTLGLGVLGAAYAQNTTTALVWISLAIGGLSAASPVGWSIPSLIAPPESVGTLGGILNFGNQLSAIAAPIATGYIVQATHSFFWAFGAAAAFLAVGIAGYVFLLGRIEVIPEPVVSLAPNGVGVFARERVAPVLIPPSTRSVCPVT